MAVVRYIERLKVSEVTGVREVSSRPNLASIVVLVLSAFYRTPPPIISYAVSIYPSHMNIPISLISAHTYRCMEYGYIHMSPSISIAQEKNDWV